VPHFSNVKNAGMFASCFSKLRHLDSISCPFAMSIPTLRSLPSGQTKMDKLPASAVMVCCSSPAFMTTMTRTSIYHQLINACPLGYRTELSELLNQHRTGASTPYRIKIFVNMLTRVAVVQRSDLPRACYGTCYFTLCLEV